MLTLIAYILFALGIILLIFGTIKKYKESRDKLDLFEIIGLFLMLPLLIAQIIERLLF